MKNVKFFWTDLLLQQVVLVSLQRRVQVHTQVVSSSYVCLVHNQMCHTQNSSFVKMRLINTCFRSFIFLSKDLFFVSEMKRLDKFLISCDVLPFLVNICIRKYDNMQLLQQFVILHLLIYRILSFQFTKKFCIIAVVLQRLLISKATFMLPSSSRNGIFEYYEYSFLLQIFQSFQVV